MIAAPEIDRLSSHAPAGRYSERITSISHRFISESTRKQRKPAYVGKTLQTETDVDRGTTGSISTGGVKPHSSSPPYIQALYRTALFTPEEERAIFRLLAQRKKEAHQLRIAGADNDSLDQLADLTAIENTIVKIRNSIVEANLRLVVSVAKRFVGSGRPDLAELISEGNSVLMRAVDLFDPEFGTRFSTYATTALQRSFMSSLKSSYRQQQRYTTGLPEAFESLEDDSPAPNSTNQVQFVLDAKFLLRQLDDRERFIVKSRFGLTPGKKPETFREIGEALDLSKERIRQILVKALEKLRQAAEEKRISLPDA